MFEKRLTWFWILLTAVALLIVGRLVQVQIVHAAEYEELAERIMTRRPDYIAAPRGTVFDRHGTPLLSDEPTSNICVHYALLSNNEKFLHKYLIRVARSLKRRGDYPAEVKLREIADQLRSVEIPRMWRRLSELTGVSETELAERAATIRARVARIRALVRRKSPKIREIEEEYQRLPVLEAVDHDVALSVRLALEDYPWLRVTPATRRVTHDADALVHVLGRLGAASEERIENDPLREDELHKLRRGDRCGISGVERLAETSLRGWRGRIISDYDWRPLERTDPVPGWDVHLTIDLGLQRKTLELLQRVVEGDPEKEPPGGLPNGFQAGAAAVVIDVATREVLALASYPTYRYDRFNEDYDRLRRDRKRLPLTFRAVQATYPPGSTCKVITLIGGLGEGLISPQTRFHCTGYLLPERPNMFRCWIYKMNPGVTHDMVAKPGSAEALDGQNAESAIRNSCNIYFFKVGGLLGPQRLCEWFTRCGLGRTQGTGLIEESPGIVPTENWLRDPRRENPRRHRKSDAWNFAIGQGEVTATPLQSANLAATIASGFWAPVHLAYDETGQALGGPLIPEQPLNEEHLKVVRRGMWRVVNERGTGRRAKLDSDDYVLCGKTGSAQSVRRVVTKRYVCEWPDGRRESVVAISRQDALARFGDEKPTIVDSKIAELFPRLEEGETLPAHAWFIGFTQPADTPRGEVPTGRVYAISVLLEYGGSGGRVAGPVAKQIAEYLVGRVKNSE
ncbi:MAG: hypothetical protein KAY37_05525 [Phycisphaerae bacterium]|nr:hypothetical protein [Phycisphaerae bacterium]